MLTGADLHEFLEWFGEHDAIVEKHSLKGERPCSY
jgi:hypothetical protein